MYNVPKLSIGFKGEVQSRITIISKHKNFPTDWCKNDENRIRNKELLHKTYPLGINMSKQPYKILHNPK